MAENIRNREFRVQGCERCGGHEEKEECGQEAEQALEAVSLSPWKSFLDYSGSQTTRIVPESTCLAMHEALHHLGLRIPETLKESAFA